MNITSLVNLIAEATGQTTEQTEATVNAALKIIRGVVASGEAVRLPDFGTFQTRHVFDKDYIPPERGDHPTDVKAVKFSPAEQFHKEVNHRS
jgi:nucleoid DNA-binding protein